VLATRLVLKPLPDRLSRRRAGVIGWYVAPKPAAASVRRSARHSAVPVVARGQTASTLAVCVPPELATVGAVPKNGTARVPRTTDAAIHRVTIEILTNAGPSTATRRCAIDNPRATHNSGPINTGSIGHLAKKIQPGNRCSRSPFHGKRHCRNGLALDGRCRRFPTTHPSAGGPCSQVARLGVWASLYDEVYRATRRRSSSSTARYRQLPARPSATVRTLGASMSTCTRSGKAVPAWHPMRCMRH
jgi:hypothetical protein